LIAQHAAGVSLVPAVHCPTYAAGARGETPVLDAAATYDATTSTATFLVLNRHLSAPLDVAVEVADRPLQRVLSASSLGGGDVKAANTWDQPQRVEPRHVQAVLAEGTLRVTVPAPGLCVVRVALVA
jgi:alpha-N-arabinofuranosidase